MKTSNAKHAQNMSNVKLYLEDFTTFLKKDDFLSNSVRDDVKN